LRKLLQELGHRIVVQTVIAGGPDAEEAVKGSMALRADGGFNLLPRDNLDARGGLDFLSVSSRSWSSSRL